jgi:hypothetical protein
MSTANPLMLGLDNALPYLIERGLLTRQTVLDGELLIANAARRNRNLRVSRKDGAGFLVKQPDDPAHGGAHTLRREAAFYSFCMEEPAAAELKALLPSLVYFDPERSLLALELYEEARPLWRYYSKFEPSAFPAHAAAATGRAMGTLHKVLCLPGPGADARLNWLGRDVPWVMQVHRPGPELLSGISPANYQTLRILQTQENLSQHLDALKALWRAEAVIHGDIKSDNVLVLPVPEGSDPKATEVRLVDWETVQVGDPAWDLAGALQDFILFWVSSMAQGPYPPEQLATTARYPLIILQSAVRSLWRGYRATSGVAASAADALILRAVRYSAARLIQSAYEMAMSAPTLPATSVLLLQISANLLADPETGQVQLYGIFQEAPSR